VFPWSAAAGKVGIPQSLETTSACSDTPAWLIKTLTHRVWAMVGDGQLNNRKLIVAQFIAVTKQTAATCKLFR